MQSERSTVLMFIIITTLFITLLIAFVVVILFLYQRRHLLYKKGLEILKADFEKNMLSTQLEIQEQTFQNISHEIHDNIGLSLTLAKLQLNTLDWENISNTRSQVNGSIQNISNAIEDLRLVSKALNTDYIREQGLLKALEKEVKKIERLGLFNIRHEIAGTPVFMDTQKELVIFRMIQELLNNSIKHSDAKDILLFLHYHSDYLIVEISDNGNGFMHENKSDYKANGTGLINIIKRAALINGICKVKSNPSKGTSVIIHIPLVSELESNNLKEKTA